MSFPCHCRQTLVTVEVSPASFESSIHPKGPGIPVGEEPFTLLPCFSSRPNSHVPLLFDNVNPFTPVVVAANSAFVVFLPPFWWWSRGAGLLSPR